MIKSKAWKWELNKEDYWQEVSDELIPIVLKWRNKNFKNALDLGSGLGRHSIFLAQNNFNVEAFDLSEEGINQLKINAGKLKLNIKTKIGDMLSLPYKDNSFDCLLAFHTIYHTDYNGLKKVISEISRVLKKNGESFITLNSKQSDSYKNEINNKIDDFTIIKTEGCEIEVPHTYLNYENVIELLNKFNIIKLQHIEDYWEGRRHAHYFILFKK